MSIYQYVTINTPCTYLTLTMRNYQNETKNIPFKYLKLNKKVFQGSMTLKIGYKYISSIQQYTSISSI